MSSFIELAIEGLLKYVDFLSVDIGSIIVAYCVPKREMILEIKSQETQASFSWVEIYREYRMDCWQISQILDVLLASGSPFVALAIGSMFFDKFPDASDVQFSHLDNLYQNDLRQFLKDLHDANVELRLRCLDFVRGKQKLWSSESKGMWETCEFQSVVKEAQLIAHVHFDKSIR